MNPGMGTQAVGELMNMAVQAADRGDFQRAMACLAEVLRQEPRHADACFGMGEMYRELGRLGEAADWYGRSVSLNPDNPALLYNLGVVRQSLGQLDEAAAAYRRAIALAPGLHPAHCNLGNLHSQAGRNAEAAECYRRALAAWPDSLEALVGLARIYQEDGQQELSRPLLARALQANGNFLPARFLLGVSHQDAREFERAIKCYMQVVQAEPGHADALFNLGKVLHDQRHFAEAETWFRRALGAVRQSPAGTRYGVGVDEVYYNLGLVLKKQKKIHAWLENLRAFEAASQGSLLLAIEGARAARHLGDPERERRYVDLLLSHAYSEKETDFLPVVLFFLLNCDIPQEAMLSLYRQYDALMGRRVAKFPPVELPARSAGARLRVGYLSPDFRRHVMGNMIAEFIPRHDRSSFDVYCYSLSRHEDDVTELIKKHSVAYRNVMDMKARDAASLIARDDLDILVDLATHTDGSVPEILAYKPARVQMTHIASAGAVGLSAIDFKLSDRYVDTEEEQRYLIEKLLPMEGCVYPFHRIFPSSDSGYSRGDLAIESETVLIGAFVTLFKLSPRCMSVWARVLARLPNAKLAFSPVMQEEYSSYLNWAAAFGIDRSRIVFIPVTGGDEDRINRYRLIDFVLDTFPYGGVNGVMEPLSMGIPVVTLCGQRHGERTAYSILRNLGVDATVAYTEDGYVELAVRLAEDSSFRETVRGAIQTGLSDSPLVDMDRHTRNLENAYRQALAISGFIQAEP